MAKIIVNKPEIILGRGNHDVVLGTLNNQQVAVKKTIIIPYPDNEEEALKRLNHPNVIKLLYVENIASYRYYALELCHGSLEKLFMPNESSDKYRGPMPPDEDVLFQLAAGLDYIHSNNYFHRDIKPANVLIKVRDSYHSEGDHRRVLMKWTDFDFSKQSESSDVSISRTTGTRCWNSPEILNKQTQSKLHRWEIRPRLDGNKSDVFSEGLVFAYFLRKGKHPFGDLGKVEVNIHNGKEPNLKDITNGPIKKLIIEMLLHDPSGRPTSEEVYKRLLKLEMQQERSDKFTFDRRKLLGRKRFVTVYEGSFNGKPVAVKRMVKESDNKITAELSIMRNLNHPNVIKLLGYSEDLDFRYFVFELCQANLTECYSQDDDELKYRGPMLSQEDILLQLSQGLAYIHARKVIHLDLEPQNVMIWNGADAFGRQKLLVKWTDYALSKFTVDRPADSPGHTGPSIRKSNNWMAPEDVLKRSSSKTMFSNIFSEALVFGYVLLKGKHLFGSEGMEIQQNIRYDNPINLKDIEERYGRILTGMVHKDPEERWNAFDVLEEMEDVKHQLTYKHLMSSKRFNTKENYRKYLREREITIGEISYNLNTPVIGAGGYGRVYVGKWGNQIDIAVKIISKRDSKDKEEEVRNEKKFNHKNVTKMIGFIEKDDTSKYIALELCVSSLDRVFLPKRNEKKYKGPELPSDFEVMYQLALGLQYIHSKRVAHRDVKPHNILIHVNPNTQKITMKLTDFGLSSFTDDDGTFLLDNVLGTSSWMAPELQKLLKEKEDGKFIKWSKQRGTIKSDIFAEGLVFAYIVLKGVHLYEPKYMSKIDYGKEDKLLEIKKNIRENKPVHLEDVQPKKVLELIKQMLHVDPDRRLTSTQVVQAITVIRNGIVGVQ